MKIAATILLIMFLAAGIGGALLIAYITDDGYYNLNGISFYDSGACSDVTSGYANTVYHDYLYLTQKEDLSAEDSFQLKRLEEKFSKENTNFFFTVTDEEGKVVLSNYEEQNYGTQITYGFDIEEPVYDETYAVNAYVKDPISAKDDYYTPYQFFNTLYSMRYLLIVIAALSGMLALLTFIFLMSSAGRRKGKEDISLNSWDKIPLDLLAAGVIMGFLLLINIDIYHFGSSYIFRAVLACMFVLVAALLALALCMTFAVRFKVGRWWENTVAYRVLKLLLRAFRLVARSIGILIGNLPLLWKVVLIFAAYIFINAMTIISFVLGGNAVAFLFGLIFNLAALMGLCFIMLQMNKLKVGGEKIALGDHSFKIDTKNMCWDIKSHAEALNNIGLGMSRAVEERLKSERLKTELITNVSHDIKTPLTSIVNYVDLIKKENIENENAKEYIVVLDRQSARLKKLTEDLLEASKASTGNITVSPERTDIVELLNQSVGEYAERFASGQLEVVINTEPAKAEIFADGRLLWRVLDNLLNNVCKYSQPNTRVYFNIDTKDKVTLTIKNISKYPLNINSNELLERFARGDSARATEGSGLGLSIAKSLTELQKGDFELSVDGDLFKVCIRFDGIDCHLLC